MPSIDQLLEKHKIQVPTAPATGSGGGVGSGIDRLLERQKAREQEKKVVPPASEEQIEEIKKQTPFSADVKRTFSPQNIEQTAEGIFDKFKGFLAEAVDSKIITKARETLLPREPSTSVARNLPGEVIRNLPLGWGAVVQNAETLTADDLTNLRETSAKEVLKFTAGVTVETAKEFAKAPFRVGLGATDIVSNIDSLTLPVLGEAKSPQLQAKERIDQLVEEGTKPHKAALIASVEQVPNVIFDTLLTAGLVQKIASPREATLLTSKNTGKPLKTTILKPPLKSFRQTTKVRPTYVPIENQGLGKPVHSALSGLKKYNPNHPTFLKIETGTKGFTARIIQIKSSLFRGGIAAISRLFNRSGRPVRLIRKIPGEVIVQSRTLTPKEVKLLAPKSSIPPTAFRPGVKPQVPPGQPGKPVTTLRDELGVPKTTEAKTKTLRDQFLEEQKKVAEAKKQAQEAVFQPDEPTSINAIEQALSAQKGGLEAPKLSNLLDKVNKQIELTKSAVNKGLKQIEQAQIKLNRAETTGGDIETVRQEIQGIRDQIEADKKIVVKAEKLKTSLEKNLAEAKKTTQPEAKPKIVKPKVKEPVELKVVEEKPITVDRETVQKAAQGDDASLNKFLKNFTPATRSSVFIEPTVQEFSNISPDFLESMKKSGLKVGKKQFPLMSNEWIDQNKNELPGSLIERIKKANGEFKKQLAEGKFELTQKKGGVRVQTESGAFSELRFAKEAKKDLTKKSIFSKKDLKELVKNNKEFAEHPVVNVVEVGGSKFLEFVGEKSRFRIKADALGLDEAGLEIGETVILNSDSLALAGENIRVVKGAEVLASKEGSPIGLFEKGPAKPASETFKLFEQVEKFVKKYAGILGEGYLPRNARGVFYTDTKNIRVDGLNNVSVAAHETTHYVDNKLNITKNLILKTKRTNIIRKKLTEIYLNYYPNARKTHPVKLRMVEGLATFIQKYVEQPTIISKEFPELVNAFLKEGGVFHNKVFNEMVKDLRSLISEYQNLEALNKIGTRVTSDRAGYDKKSFLSKFDRIRTEIADEIYPLEVLAKKAGVEMTDKDLSLFARMYSSITAPILNNINGKRGYWVWKDGKFEKLHEFNWKSLVNQLADKSISDPFSYYLVARDTLFSFKRLDALSKQVIELKNQIEELGGVQEVSQLENGKALLENFRDTKKQRDHLAETLKKDAITRAESQEAYEQNRERFLEEEDMFDKLIKADLDLLHNKDVQLINKEVYKELSSREGYASKKRDFFDELVGSEQQKVETTLRVGKTRVSSLLQRKGSQRAIVNPVYSGIKNHAEISRKAFKQIVYNKIFNIYPNFPELFQKLQLQAVPDGRGGFLFPQERDPNVIMARKDFKRVPILVDAQVKRVFDEVLNYQNISYFEKVLLSTARFFTKGTTATYIHFAGSNFMIDQFTAAANTVNNYVPIYDNIRKLWGITSENNPHHRYMQEYMVLGGEKQTLVGWQDFTPQQLLDAINNEVDGLRRAINVLSKGADIVALPSKYSEIITRMTEYIKAREAGKPQLVALEQAGRVTAPFHHQGRLGGGRIGKTLVKSVPFFNPAIQVLDQSLRRLATREGATRYAFIALAIATAMGASLAYLLQAGTEEQKQQYKDLDPELLPRYIYLPRRSGNGLVRIRVPENLSLPGTIMNMIIADQLLDTDYRAGEYLTASTAWLPEQFNITDPTRMVLGTTPQIIKPISLFFLGKKDFPEVRDLEPKSVQDLPTEFRTTEGTSAVAKIVGQTELAKKLDLSPIEVDFLITGYAGRAANFLLVKPGIYNPLASFTLDYYFTSGRSLERYYEIRQEVTEGRTATKEGFEELGSEERALITRKRALISSIEKRISAIKKVDLEENEEDPEIQAKINNWRAEIFERIDQLKELK